VEGVLLADVGAALDKKIEVAKFPFGKVVGARGGGTDQKRGTGYSYIDPGETCPENGVMPGLLNKQSGQKLQSGFFWPDWQNPGRYLTGWTLFPGL
jgi:hypothetical protein